MKGLRLFHHRHTYYNWCQKYGLVQIIKHGDIERMYNKWDKILWMFLMLIPNKLETMLDECVASGNSFQAV